MPFNQRFAEETDEDAYAPEPEFDGPALIDLAEHLLPMSENQFLRRYEDSPIIRARRKGLLRNVCVGLGNRLVGEGGAPEEAVDEAAEGTVDERVKEGVHIVIRAPDDDRPLVPGHAAWALGVVGGRSTSAALSVLDRVAICYTTHVRTTTRVVRVRPRAVRGKLSPPARSLHARAAVLRVEDRARAS